MGRTLDRAATGGGGPSPPTGETDPRAPRLVLPFRTDQRRPERVPAKKPPNRTPPKGRPTKGRAPAPAPRRRGGRRGTSTRVRVIWAGVAAALLVALGVGLALGTRSGSSTPPTTSATSSPSGSQGPEGVNIPPGTDLAPADTMVMGTPVDGVLCQTHEQFVYHIHAHLAVFVNGTQYRIPYGIGIVPPREVQNTALGPFVAGGKCFYWLHTHAADGIIHIESPVEKVFKLGNFFNLWQQPLSNDQVGPARGHITTFVNGRRFAGNPRNIALFAHTVIQLDVGSPVVGPQPITFPPGL